MAPAVGASSVVGMAEEAATRRVKVARTLKRILVDMILIWLSAGYLEKKEVGIGVSLEVGNVEVS